MDEDPVFAKRVRSYRVVPQLQVMHSATRYLFQELVRPFLIDRSIKANRNHAIDLMHAIVPLAYCDIVLLDPHWKTQADKISRRLASQPLISPIAKVISGKKAGIERFLHEMEQKYT